MNVRIFPCLFGLIILVTSGQDTTAQPMDPSLVLKRIDTAYFERDKGNNLKDAELLCEEALGQGLPQDEILWRKARFKAWDGVMAKDSSGKLELFRDAEQSARKAIETNSESIEGHFWLGVALGRIGETQGIFKSFSLIEPIRHEMEVVLKLNPNHAGAHHLLGVMYLKLPWFKGGSHEKSRQELQKSIELNDTNTLYHLDLAKTYMAMNRSAEAYKELEKVRTIPTPFDAVQAGFDRREAEVLERKIRSDQ